MLSVTRLGRNAESTAVDAAMTSSLAQQEAFNKSNNETAREPCSALISVPDDSHLRNEVKQPRSGRGGTFSRRGGSVEHDTRHTVEMDGRGSSYDRGRGRGDVYRGRGGEDGRGRGRLLDLSHARGRGRAGVMLDRSRHEEEAANSRSIRGHEFGHGQRAHHRGGRPGFGGRLAHGYSGRGRGAEPDAEFDRGGKPSGHRQLYQAPMGIRSEARPEQSGNKSGSNERRKQAMREDSDVDRHNEEHGEHSGSDGDMLDSPEPAARPGIINTGIDVAALHNSGRKGKGERRERNRRREGRDRSQGQGKSHDAVLMDEREVVNGSRDDTARRHHSSPYRGPPPPPFEDGPHPFPHYHPPPPHGPHHDYLPPPPPPPGGFHHHHPPGPPPPPPGFWPPRPFDSPPSRHRGFAEEPSYRKPPRNERNPKRDRIPGAGRGYDSASHRDTGSRDGHDRSSIGLGSPVPGPRQLFDPGRDDPVKFSAQKSAIGSEPANSALASDARSVASSATRTSISSLSVASSDYRSRYSGRSDALLDEVESTASGAGSNALLRELKASYREILSVEAKLQDEDSYAKSAIEEQARIYGHDADDQGPHEKRPDEYWAKLVQLHRE